VLKTPERDPLPYGVRPPQFRLPDAAHVGGVHLQVSDVRRSMEYYDRVIGLRAQATPDGRVALSAGDDGTPLVTLSTRPGVTSARPGAFGLYHFAMLLPDRAALGRFAAHLAELGLRVGMADHLVSEALYLRDPDGLGIEVYADRPRETWQRHGQELAMTADPLDRESLIAAGGGEPWTGTPRGTTMGHVHLHVGRLDQAEAFYHRAVGLDKTVWSYPGALFMSAGGYHHHLGTNVWSAGPGPSRDEAQLLEWELLVPSASDVANAAESLEAAGYEFVQAVDSVTTADPWGTPVRIRAAQ
jgi:catechol 2,3-dioxygenase